MTETKTSNEYAMETKNVPNKDMASIVSQLLHHQLTFLPLDLCQKRNKWVTFIKYKGVLSYFISYQILNFKTFGWHSMLCYASYAWSMSYWMTSISIIEKSNVIDEYEIKSSLIGCRKLRSSNLTGSIPHGVGTLRSLNFL